MVSSVLVGKVTSRGQITVPQSLRESTGIEPNGYVVFRQVGSQLVVAKTVPSMAELDVLLEPIRAEAKRQKLSRKDILSEIKKVRKGL